VGICLTGLTALTAGFISFGLRAPRPRLPVPESAMNRNTIATYALIVIAIVSSGLASVRAANEFPYDAVLLLDVAPMKPLKRVPILTVAENGSATIELWCRTAAARVELSDSAIKIEVAPLPEAMPQYMSAGQCSEDRVQADNEMLEAVTQATEWRRRGDGIELIGPKPLRFRASSH
jgi:hypothetical protein